MKIAFFSTKSYDHLYFDSLNQYKDIEITYFEVPLNHNTVKLVNGFDAICVFVNDVVDAFVIEQLRSDNVGLIALRCAGFNNVDLKAAKNAGISIVRVPSYSPEAVAEHAVALLLTLARKTHKAYNRVREGNFSLEKITGTNISGKTVGVVGTGKIGASFCAIMKGFGCDVIAYDVVENPSLLSMGVSYTDKSSLFRRSDIISLHCPLNDSTHYLINDSSLKEMKDGVILINTSRGALIDTKAVIKGLKSGKIGALGIDVYEQEETLFFQDRSEDIIQDDDIMRLITFPNVLITGHQGFFTHEALEEIARTTLENLYKYNSGQPSGNEVILN